MRDEKGEDAQSLPALRNGEIAQLKNPTIEYNGGPRMRRVEGNRSGSLVGAHRGSVLGTVEETDPHFRSRQHAAVYGHRIFGRRRPKGDRRVSSTPNPLL